MSFKVIDGDGPGKEERDKERQRGIGRQANSLGRSARPLPTCIRKSSEVLASLIQFLMQMKKTIDSAINFQELHGYWPNDVMANKLRLQDEVDDCLERGRSGALAQEHIDRWTKDCTFEQMSAEHTLYRGVLQRRKLKQRSQTTVSVLSPTGARRLFRALERAFA